MDTAQQILRARKHIEASESDREAERAELAKQLADNTLMLKRLVRSIGGTDSAAEEKYLREQMEEFAAKEEEMRQKFSALEAQRQGSMLTDVETEAICHRLAVPWNETDAYTTEEKRAAVRACIRCVYWDGERAQIYLHGAAEEKVPLCEDSE